MPPFRSTGDGRNTDHADFWAPDPSDRTWRDRLAGLTGPSAARAGARGRATGLLVGALSLVLTVPAAPAHAAPLAPPPPAESLDSLLDRADSLSEEYNGELRDMEGVIEDAEKAEERAETTRAEVDEAKEQVRQLAVVAYTSGGLDPALSLFIEADPQETIDRALLVDHLATTNNDKIEHLVESMERDDKAQESAQEKLDQVEDDLDELEGRRREVQKLIADYPVQEMGPPDSLTPRTRQMRNLVVERFGENRANGGYGCYRQSGGYVVGEHPKGRACDFMVNGNGQMPTEEQQAHGQAIADWAQDNAGDLGIMYIIWRQQIWDIRRGDEGWRQMADRGSVTENHYDHVHISMF
ncbi:coiled-coil domain-containing protein [Actinorugispora endophytica]|uniref:ARB-07466-like C-terminal domain-containing protein n=1 Tax=Actinorugispora endophytica TaxID=1605990 RepID=A0A4R6UY37_9ACTN|nr:hypothetical protein [Actinorugispora endophytica]TDQ52402.1 hypothetical protein EV190_10640 [Actinorugispora endophytica]